MIKTNIKSLAALALVVTFGGCGGVAPRSVLDPQSDPLPPVINQPTQVFSSSPEQKPLACSGTLSMSFIAEGGLHLVEGGHADFVHHPTALVDFESNCPTYWPDREWGALLAWARLGVNPLSIWGPTYIPPANNDALIQVGRGTVNGVEQYGVGGGLWGFYDINTPDLVTINFNTYSFPTASAAWCTGTGGLQARIELVPETGERKVEVGGMWTVAYNPDGPNALQGINNCGFGN